MKIKLDGENGIFLLSDETGVKIYNIGKNRIANQAKNL